MSGRAAAIAASTAAREARGYAVVYHEGDVNRCPGCGRTSWYIGRSTAECAFCGAAIPLAGKAG